MHIIYMYVYTDIYVSYTVLQLTDEDVCGCEDCKPYIYSKLFLSIIKHQAAVLSVLSSVKCHRFRSLRRPGLDELGALISHIHTYI